MPKSKNPKSSSKPSAPPAKKGGRPGPVSSRLAILWRDEKTQILTIFALALLIRLLHLFQMKANSPFYDLPAVDGAFYDSLAQQIAGGNWVGAGVFAYNPLYPYFLGLIYLVFGHSFTVVKFLQMVIGSGSCVLIFLLARKLFRRTVGIIAALLAVFYAVFIFYDELMLAESLSIFTLLLACLMLLRIQDTPTLGRLVTAGLCVGLATLSRPTVLPVAAFIFIAFIFQAKPKRHVLKCLVVFGLAFLCVLAPVSLRNYLVGHDLVLITSHMGLNFYLGNNPEANGWFTIPTFIPRTSADSPADQQAFFTSYAEKETGRQLKPSEVSSFWQKKGWEFITGQPGKWLKLTFRKAMLLVNEYEASDNQHFYQSKGFSSVLRLPLVTYGLVCPLALLGMVLCLPQWRKALLLYLFVLLYAGSLLFFFIGSRYRLPLVPLLIIFAAYAVYWLWQAVLHRKYKPLAKAVLLLGLLLVLTHNNVYSGSKDPSYVDLFNVANKYRDKGRLDKAVQMYVKSIQRNPNYISSHNNLALAYEQKETWRSLAITEWENVLRMGREMQNETYVSRAERHLADLGKTPPGQSPHK